MPKIISTCSCDLCWLIGAEGTARAEWFGWASQAIFLKKLNHGANLASQGEKEGEELWQTLEFILFSLRESLGK